VRAARRKGIGFGVASGTHAVELMLSRARFADLVVAARTNHTVTIQPDIADRATVIYEGRKATALDIGFSATGWQRHVLIQFAA